MTATPSQAAMPLATAHRARVSGVVSWSSSRPDVSSDEPGRDERRRREPDEHEPEVGERAAGGTQRSS